MSIFNNNSNTIIVNGKSYSTQGSNISVSNGKVVVNGKVIEEGLTGEVTIKFVGDLADLQTDGSVTVNGNVKGDAKSGGSMSCGDVGGNARSGGSMNCKNISGGAKSGGSMSVGSMR